MKAILNYITGVLAVISGLLLCFYISRARMPYENGNYYDVASSTVYYEQVADVAGAAAAVSTLMTILVFAIARSVK